MKSGLICTALFCAFLAPAAHAGFIEICKDSSPAGSLNGLFSFTISGQAGTFPAPVGACTPAIQLPNGLVTVTEVPRPGSVFFSAFTFPVSRLISFDLATSSAVVQIVNGDISTQTALTFVNTPMTVPTGIPEPATAWLLGAGVAFWAIRRNLGWPETRPKRA